MNHRPDTSERGRLFDFMIVRLADEGVPVRALVRVFKRSFGDVLGVIDEAIANGHLLYRPASEWPEGTRRENRLPTRRHPSPHLTVEDDHEDLTALKLAFGLTVSEALLLLALYRRPEMTKPSLHLVISREPVPTTEMKIVDVYVCKLRRKLRLHDLEIRTIWGIGYALPALTREAISRVLSPGLPGEPA